MPERPRLLRLAASLGLAAALLAPAPFASAQSPPPFPAWPHAPGAESLEHRFPAPPDFARALVDPGSFGDFLRTLPLREPGAPVLDFHGRVQHPPDDPGVAAVVDIDVGAADLQQCADFVLRLDAEWRYARGSRDIGYRIASGDRLAYARYLGGERAVMADGKLTLRPAATPARDDHAVLRAYLDEVFAWANTASLERSTAPVPLARVAPGDVFVVSGRPYGHAVLVLDVARDSAGRIALLLGEGYMPAQSFHVLRANAQAWFILDPDATEVVTPFWAPFPIRALRRLP